MLDKSWFNDGPPKKYGCATVFVCRKKEIYRVKPCKASRKTFHIRWGKTDDEQKERWKRVMEKVREYNMAV